MLFRSNRTTSAKGSDAAAMEIDERIDMLFSQPTSENFGRSYDSETTKSLRSKTSKEQFCAMGAKLGAKLGALEKKKLLGDKPLQIDKNSSAVDVSYAAVFKEGEGKILASFRRESGSWKIASLRVMSELLDD